MCRNQTTVEVKLFFSLQLGVSYKYEMTVHSTEITPKKLNVSYFVLH